MGLNVETIYSINALSGQCGDPVAVAKYLKEVDDNIPKYIEDPHDIRYQDKLLPQPLEEPVAEVYNYIVREFGNFFQKERVKISMPWTIVNGPEEQIYPHWHQVDQSNTYSVVYWAQVPQNSGDLEIYPMGICSTCPFVRYPPQEGHFLIFPANLLHGVRSNASKQDRISMSFNIELEES